MATLLHRGPLSITPPIIHSLHHKSFAAQSPDVPIIHSSKSGHIEFFFAVFFGQVFLLILGTVVRLIILRYWCTDHYTDYDGTSEMTVDSPTWQSVTPSLPYRSLLQGYLDPGIIESFPSIQFSAVRRIKSNKLRYGPECAICLSGFTDEEMLRLLPGCRHVFHAACIETWLASHVTCPVCRANLADPLVAAAGESLMLDLAEERYSDTVEIVVEVFHPDLNPDAVTELHQRRVYSENARQELDLEIRHRRAASLVSFQGRRSAPLESLIRNSSVHRQIQPGSGSGQRSSRWILDGTLRHSDPGERPVKLFLHGLWRNESSRYDAGDESQRSEQEIDPTGSQNENNYADYVSYEGFVIHGNVAANDWLPEIFQVSTAMQSPPSN